MPEQIRAIDANVVLRYLLRDVPEQTNRAHHLIDSERPLGLTAVVLAEVAWTLRGPRYRRPRSVVADLLERLLARENAIPIGFDRDEARAALVTCGQDEGAADFGDALIAACARSFGVLDIHSFDQRFGRAGLTVIAPP